ncbi:MAG: glycosyltransferase family 2 protein [Clostridiales bacterium]|nr:glycosyltransferase family 2 protein [Clostridiales bacterium]
MKKVSILIPCYNEELNVVPMSEAITNLFETQLTQYDWELVFIDNDSQDKTRVLLRQICEKNKHIKAIFNVRNFGQFNSPYYGILQTTGDCTISMVCDFQDPIELIPQYLKEWENGYKIVIGIKTKSKENKLMRLVRTAYYKLIKSMSDVEQIEHFTGSGLYDKDFVNVLRDLHDPTPFLRGIVAEMGWKRKTIPYEQPKRERGKTSNNFYRLYDAAMLSITSYTKVGLRLATIFGAILACLSLLVGFLYFILKLLRWYDFPAGNIPILLAVIIFGSVQIFFIGFLGEYILSINSRIMKRPLVIEEERLNFDVDEKSDAEKEGEEKK